MEAGQTTTPQAMMTLVTTIVGAGILAFPATFARGGWFWSPIILVASAWAVVEIGNLLTDALHFVQVRVSKGEIYSFKKPQRYDDICEVAWGLWGKRVAGISVNGYLLMIGGAFIILITDSIMFLFSISAANSDYVLFGVTAFFVPLSLLDDMRIIANLSGIGVLASILYAFAIGIAGVQATGFVREPEYTWILEVSKMMELGAVISVMLIGFTYQMVAPTVWAEMEKPRELPSAVRGAVAIVALVYAAAGGLAYYGWGNSVEGNINGSMRYPDGAAMTAGLILSGAVTANLLVTFPIIMNCVYRAAEAAVNKPYSVPVRLALLTVAVLIGKFLPFFFPFLTLIGAVLGVAVGIFIPLAIYWTLARHEGIRPMNEKAKVAKHAVITFLGIIAGVFGTYSAVVDLIAAIKG